MQLCQELQPGVQAVAGVRCSCESRGGGSPFTTLTVPSTVVGWRVGVGKLVAEALRLDAGR
jgi:hypothetical protein